MSTYKSTVDMAYNEYGQCINVRTSFYNITIANTMFRQINNDDNNDKIFTQVYHKKN